MTIRLQCSVLIRDIDTDNAANPRSWQNSGVFLSSDTSVPSTEQIPAEIKLNECWEYRSFASLGIYSPSDKLIASCSDLASTDCIIKESHRENFTLLLTSTFFKEQDGKMKELKNKQFEIQFINKDHFEAFKEIARRLGAKIDREVTVTLQT